MHAHNVSTENCTTIEGDAMNLQCVTRSVQFDQTETVSKMISFNFGFAQLTNYN